MAFRYVLEPNSGDSHQITPYWLALVVPFFYRVTADRMRILDQNSAYKQDISLPSIDGMREGPKILWEHEIFQWSTSHSKTNPQGTLTMSLSNTGIDWRRKVAGGDWIMFWAFDNREDYIRIRSILRQVKDRDAVLNDAMSFDGLNKQKNACNSFHDGLKFVGRVASVRRYRSRRPDSGIVTSQYAISAISFREVAYKVHFNPAFRGAYGQNDLQFILDASGVNDFILAGGQGAIPAGKAVATLLNACLGRGLGEKWTFGLRPSTPTENQIATASPTGGVRVAVPQTVGVLLNGVKSPEGYNFSDISHAFIGLQSYANDNVVRRQAGVVPAESGLVPVVGDDNFLEGLYVPQALDFNEAPIWRILGTYLNAPINEIYTTLHVGSDGCVRPTIVARQSPFSSRYFDNHNSTAGTNIKTGQTAFVDLPRWVISPKLVETENLGSSDAVRFNYIHLPATDITLASNSAYMNENALYVLAPPFVDRKDIERNGLSVYTKGLSTNMNVANFARLDHSPAGYYTALMADLVTTQHLRFSGSLTLTGIQEPICVGSNIEYDGGIYHIEQINHSGGIQGVGMRSFTTELLVSSGISTASDDVGSYDNVYMIDTPEVILEDDRPGWKFGMGSDTYLASGGPQHEEPKDKAPEDADAVGFRVYDGVTVERNED